MTALSACSPSADRPVCAHWPLPSSLVPPCHHIRPGGGSGLDANEDELRYKLLVKKDGWERWVEVDADLEKAEYEWDTSATPSGVYQLKVVASDAVDNPVGEALTGEDGTQQQPDGIDGVAHDARASDAEGRGE